MRFRKLRIAWSVGCGIASVLLIVLWVRSYWWHDVIHGPVFKTGTVNVVSYVGRVGFNYYSGRGRQWRTSSKPIGVSHAPTPDELGALSRLSGRSAIAPYSVFSVAFAVAAALPWLRWRFSLRTLLFAATLVAVVLGLLVYVVIWPNRSHQLPQELQYRVGGLGWWRTRRRIC